jgi:methionyl-tRNA formyltransferase
VTSSLSIVFAGTPEFSVPPLRALLASPHRIAAVYTQPDRPAGRGRQLAMSAVKQCALEHQLPVFQPSTLRDAAQVEALAALKPDVMVVVAYGLILPAAMARGRADSSRYFGRRCEQRRHHHADGRGVGYRSNATGV